MSTSRKTFRKWVSLVIKYHYLRSVPCGASYVHPTVEYGANAERLPQFFRKYLEKSNSPFLSYIVVLGWIVMNLMVVQIDSAKIYEFLL